MPEQKKSILSIAIGAALFVVGEGMEHMGAPLPALLGAFAIAEHPEAVGVMLFYRVGEYFEDRAVAQSREQIMSAVDLRSEVVNLVVCEEIRVIGAEEANVGDILLVLPGDRIPLDGVAIEGESRIDTSPVTGEPVPMKAAVVTT